MSGSTARETLSPASPIAVPAVAPLVSDRLRLRPLSADDRRAFLALIERNRESLEGRIPLNEAGETAEAFFDRQLALTRDGDTRRSSMRRVAELRTGGDNAGELVGCFNLNSITRGLEWEADAVWWISRDHRMLGLATEGVKALLGHAFAPMPTGLGLHSVHCGIEPGNTASLRVAEKCGFRHRPGRQSYLKIGQRWVMHDFYLARPDAGPRP